MAPIHEACIAFSHNRSCFISVPEKWIAHDLAFQDIPVIKIEYSDSHKAYFSTKVGVPSSCFEVDVQLNGKYAQSLGLKEGEQVLVQQVEGNTVHAEKVYLEPLNSDDWEIMELNTAIIEKDLLNQIRVVWKGQVFPIWAHNASFCVRVAEVEPDIEPVLLVEWTEIHVIPKDRNAIGALGYLPSLKQKRKDMCEQYKHLRKTKKLQKSSHASSQQSSPASDVVDSDKLELPGTFSLPAGQASLPAIRPSFSLFRYVMKTVFQNESHHLSQSNKSFSSRFIPLNVIFRLRVISCSKNTTEGLPLALQATTVFISDTTFRALCDIYPIPNCFVAMLSKLPSPDDLKERQQALQAQLQTAKDSKSRKKKSEILPIEKNSILDSIYVNVVVLRSLKEEFEAPLALFMNRNFIAVPLEIKRRLGLEISSCVRCQSVEKPPIALNSIILHPLESLKGNFTDAQITEAFRKWAEDANLEDSSMVLADGTLVKLNINKSRSCDFIVLMLQSENEDVAVTSPSTLSNTSMSSTDSEKNIGPLPSTLNYGFLNYENLPNLQIKYGVFSPQLSKSIWCHGSALNKVEVLYQRLPALGLEALGGVKKLAEEAMIDFELWFHLSPLALEFSSRAFNIGCMLVHGPKGVGKTTLLKALCKNLMNYPYFIFISIIECLPLRGKRVETISKKWDAVLAEAAHRQPALIIFEDLDKLASAPATPEQEAGPDAIYFSSVAQTFITLTEKIMDNKASIVVVATAKSIHDLYPSLNTAQGRHVFQSILEIKPPTVEYRFEMLQSLVLSKIHISADSLETVDWRNLARVTEGYVAQDLESLVDRATHAAFVRTNFAMEKNSDGTEQISLIYDDFENALATYTPSSLRGLQLQDGNNKTWNDVGGLQQVKAAIEETIVWPIRYKELFKDYHLRPQTNILLYGVPGTGKTMIAGVVASECGLNFISIKGPELLSKYIGASEQAVRDLFARAASAKPCVLFFDEFDALAPQRGHDSTGVTDRVVNQLLTQMDGVENLEGVYILAATSRPELIDPALLRPGRFDKCLLCPLPNNEERLAILIALSSKLSLSEDVDFKAIIPMTEYFSGADLQALLYSAQIQAVRETQASRSRRCSISVDDTYELPFEERITYMPTLEQGAVVPSVAVANEIVQEMNTLFNNISLQNGEPESTRRRRTSTISLLIEQRHILNVLSDTRPSVSAEERRRYERIFKKFQKSPATGFSSPDKDNKRVTLA